MLANQVHDTDVRLAVWQAYLQTHAAVIRLLETALQKEKGLPLLWYDTLEALVHAPLKSLRLQDLAEAINLSQSGLTRLLDRMAESGLVERRPCPNDRRGLFAAITPTGEDMLAQARLVYQQVLDEHFLRYLSCDEVAALNKVFTNIVQMESAHAPSREFAADGTTQSAKR
jgi:DNA-binding MarR family transcriptional regulator